MDNVLSLVTDGLSSFRPAISGDVAVTYVISTMLISIIIQLIVCNFEVNALHSNYQ